MSEANYNELEDNNDKWQIYIPFLGDDCYLWAAGPFNTREEAAKNLNYTDWIVKLGRNQVRENFSSLPVVTKEALNIRTYQLITFMQEATLIEEERKKLQQQAFLTRPEQHRLSQLDEESRELLARAIAAGFKQLGNY